MGHICTHVIRILGDVEKIMVRTFDHPEGNIYPVVVIHEDTAWAPRGEPGPVRTLRWGVFGLCGYLRYLDDIERQVYGECLCGVNHSNSSIRPLML